MLRYFRMDEFKCKGDNCCGGKNLMDTAFLEEIDELRSRYGKPLFISSAYRCPIHNSRVSKTGTDGPHTTGRACDFAVSHAESLSLLKIALDMKFTGIGINQKGGGRFIHVDNLPNGDNQPRPHLWSY